jgi:hypothetical protein
VAMASQSVKSVAIGNSRRKRHNPICCPARLEEPPMSIRYFFVALLLLILPSGRVFGLDRPGTVFKIFQFPPNMIPRIDGNDDDWKIVPDDYAIGLDQMVDDMGHYKTPDLNRLNATVKVGWVKGMNQLYFLYQATKSYWDFSLPGLKNDIFEVVVNGDTSGGPFIDEQRFNAEVVDRWDSYFSMHGVHAQNYHIFTPAKDKDWCMFWGPQAPWIKQLPYSNCATNFNFKPGESGKLTLEFWITPFDYCSADGPDHSIMSKLTENKIIGLSWAILDYGDVNRKQQDFAAFWNLSRHHEMFGNASELCAFKLMPLEPQFQKTFEADWSFKVIDMDRRLVAFKDLSVGNFTSWKWDFGDGQTSTDQNPIHQYKNPNHYTVILDVDGPAGHARRSKVWDVAVK